MIYHQTANSLLTVCLTRGDKRSLQLIGVNHLLARAIFQETETQSFKES